MKSFILSLAAVLAITGCRSVPVTHGTPNYHEVDERFSRSGQPTNESWPWLHSQGFANVVKLDTEAEGSDDAAWTNGIAVYYVPVTFWQQVGLDPMPENFSLRYESNVGRTLVHCLHGEDRTGLFIAIYRVRACGWTVEAAEQEMLAMGFHKSLLGLWEYWEQFKAEQSKTTKNP